jgi:hypothetical protein
MKMIKKILLLLIAVALVVVVTELSFNVEPQDLRTNLFGYDDDYEDDYYDDDWYQDRDYYQDRDDDVLEEILDECTEENTWKWFAKALAGIDLAEEKIEKKEDQGKDVSKALESLDQAKAELEEAEELLGAGECVGALVAAKASRHTSNLAKSKDVRSVSPRALVARAFGKCISTAAKAKNFGAFADCHQEFKKAVHDQVEDEMSEEDQAANEQISERIDELLEDIENEDLRDMLEEFQEYNFSGVDPDVVIAEIEEILSSEMSTEEKIAALELLLDELKEISAANKYDDDILPFSDTDDNEWFYAYADVLKEEECISGYVNEDGTLTGEFGPGEDVLFGESLKFVLSCMLGEEPEPIGEDDFWALGWAYSLQTEYADYVSDEFLDRVEAAIVDNEGFNEGMTRGDILLFIVGILDIEVPEADDAPFDDVPLDHDAADAVAHLVEMGVISGDEETNTFRPDDIPNRAEMVKVIIMSKELL